MLGPLFVRSCDQTSNQRQISTDGRAYLGWGGFCKHLSKQHHPKRPAQRVGRLTTVSKAEIQPLQEAQQHHTCGLEQDQ